MANANFWNITDKNWKWDGNIELLLWHENVCVWHKSGQMSAKGENTEQIVWLGGKACKRILSLIENIFPCEKNSSVNL